MWDSANCYPTRRLCSYPWHTMSVFRKLVNLLIRFVFHARRESRSPQFHWIEQEQEVSLGQTRYVSSQPSFSRIYSQISSVTKRISRRVLVTPPQTSASALVGSPSVMIVPFPSISTHQSSPILVVTPYIFHVIASFKYLPYYRTLPKYPKLLSNCPLLVLKRIVGARGELTDLASVQYALQVLRFRSGIFNI